MKRAVSVIMMAVVVAVICLARGGLGEQKPSKEFTNIMQAKLAHSQSMLGALAVEDFTNLSKQAHTLSTLSLDASWNILQTPQYAEYSEAFRRACDLLDAEAKSQDLDGATLAYMRVTLACVDCHKYVRHHKP